MTAWLVAGIGAALGTASLVVSWQLVSTTNTREPTFFHFATARGRTFFAFACLLGAAAIGVFSWFSYAMPHSEQRGAPATSEAKTKQLESVDADIARIGAYLEQVGRAPKPQPQSIQAEEPADGLPDVETMIARLVLRLEGTPDDVDGWRTLGWSYRNTGRPEKAVAAYERAAALAPERADIADALGEARRAGAAATKSADVNEAK